MPRTFLVKRTGLDGTILHNDNITNNNFEQKTADSMPGERDITGSVARG